MDSCVRLSDAQFNSNGYWTKPIKKLLYIPIKEDVYLFDQNGYALTDIERHFALSNGVKPKIHRQDQYTLKDDWFIQEFDSIEGPVLNHSFLSERKGYKGEALEELLYWSKQLPLLHKIIAIRPKWGMDFSMDYVDRDGNSFEILHWEWDSFDFDEISHAKEMIEPILLAIDWEDAAQNILKHKEEWHHLDFFGQSDWKCNFFGIQRERFKMVIWQ